MFVQTCRELRIENSPRRISLVNSKGGLTYERASLEQPFLLEILIYCTQPRIFDDICNYLASLCDRYTDNQCKLAINTLIEAKLLETSAQDSLLENNKIQVGWESRGWTDALRYHVHINHLKKSNYKSDPKGIADKTIMRSYLQEEPSPSNYKEYEDRPIIQLKSLSNIITKQKNISDIYTANVSQVNESEPPSFEEISWLLKLGFGQTGLKNMPVSGEHVTKTVPSGGSRHPTEVYPIIFTAEGIQPGSYHYNVKSHTLELLESGNHEDFVRKHVITHPSRPKFKMQIAFIFTTVFDRSMFRYRESRSYKVLHYDVGHVMQNFASLSSSVGRSSYRGYSFHDDIVDNFLKIDGLVESSLSFLVLG
jgi:SagB-type dehydrogenase family enzyme